MITLLLAMESRNKYLEKVLEETKEIRDELIVLMTYEPEKDEMEILKKYSCKLMKLTTVPIEYLINQGIEEVKEPWILLLREDEFLDSLALSELKVFKFPKDIDAYAFRRKCFLKAVNGNILFFFNFPDPRIRLFKKECKFNAELYSIDGWKKCKYFPRGHIVLDKLHVKKDLFFKSSISIIEKIKYR